jgi:hypothetical protein
MGSQASTREDFAQLGQYQGNAKGLYEASRGRDFDIELGDWIAAAAPSSDAAERAQTEAWASAWIYCSRWAGTVGRRPAYILHAQRGGVGLWLQATADRIIELAGSWTWPTIDQFETASVDELGYSYSLAVLADHVWATSAAAEGASSRQLDPRGELAGQDEYKTWLLALRLELRARGQLTKSFTEVSEYDGSPRITITPTQLYADAFGRPIPRSRTKKIVDEWCDFLSSGQTSIRYLDIESRAPKRLVSALTGQTQLRGLRIKWGDYDDVSALAAMPELWIAELSGASALTDLQPLGSAQALRVLRLGHTQGAPDFSPLGDLRTLEELEIVVQMSATAGIPSIAFLRDLTALRHLNLGGRVLDNDYSPLLSRLDLETLGLFKQKAMTPSFEELVRAIPALR